jgi:hypothetical protein
MVGEEEYAILVTLPGSPSLKEEITEEESFVDLSNEHQALTRGDYFMRRFIDVASRSAHGLPSK